jgi:hypothetical protein
LDIQAIQSLVDSSCGANPARYFIKPTKWVVNMYIAYQLFMFDSNVLHGPKNNLFTQIINCPPLALIPHADQWVQPQSVVDNSAG